MPQIRDAVIIVTDGSPEAIDARMRDAAPDRDLVFLRDDVEALQNDWLCRLQQAAYSDPCTGIVGCRLVAPDWRLRHAGMSVIADTGSVQYIGAGEADLRQYLETRTVPAISFACAYVRREALNDAGTFSGDYEYCLHAAERGYTTLCCGNVVMRCNALPEGTIDAPERYTSSLAWQSLMNLPIGYAASSREILRALDERGVRLTYSYAYGRGTPWPFTEPEASGDPLLDAIRKRPEPRRPPVVVTYAAGNVFERNHGAYRIGFTMIEVDGFPREWVRQANLMDEVWTPTEFNREGLIRGGVTKPVHIVPLGVDRDHFHTSIKRIPNPRGDYVFLANFEWGMRKAPEILLRAFNRAFRASERVILVCKIINRDRTIDVANEVLSLGLDARGGRIYFLYNQEMPHYQLATMYRSADCFVSPSRGEGWGLPALEAMACGLPVIATDWGGQRAILDPGDTYPLRARAIVSADPSGCDYYLGLHWAEPDEAHLSELLRHVYEHPDEAREKGVRASERARNALTWRETARAIERHLTRIGV